MTDEDDATDTTSQTVTVSSGNRGGEEDLVGSSVNNGSTWTAVVTDNSGGELNGTWDLGTGSCDANMYEFSGIHKRNGSVTFTSSTGTTVTVNKP